jgi:putative CocE/NonD family hydrolase
MPQTTMRLTLALATLAALQGAPGAARPVRVERGLEARMRDGVVLRADVLRPDRPGRFPALLIRTPYGKALEWGDDDFAMRAAREGYVVVVQDVRGRFASEGVFDPYRQEGRDGYDTIAWVAGLPYCDGKVGLTGLSYPAAVQWLAAVEAPKALRAMAPSMTFSTGRAFCYFGGAFDLSWLPWFYREISPDVRRRLDFAGPRTAEEADRAWAENGEAWLRQLPLATHPALAGTAPAFFEWLAHPDDGPYWDFLRIESRYDRVRVPVLNLSGWHDEGYGPGSAARNFAATRQWGGRLVIGPWTHGTPTPRKTRVGDLDFGKSAGLDYEGLLLRFFDRWLRGADNGIEREAPVRIFVMGDNAWRDEAEFPLARARPTSYYLRAGGRLAPEAPEAPEPPDGYEYDPLDPLVDPHGGTLGPFDQSPLEARRDVLAYRSEPLARDLEATGPIEIELWASSSARDTDFIVRLLDVHPDGKAFNLMSPTLEVLRARYRNGESRPELLEPGRVVKLRLANGITSNVFKAGHRIAIHVTSSLLPHLDRNTNTGGVIATDRLTLRARQRVYHDPGHPSRMVLPVIPR